MINMTDHAMRDTDAVFRALSDPARRRLLDRLNEHNGLTLGELCVDMGMTRQSVSKHLDVLEEADLVATLRRGREKLHYLNAAPINDIADRFIHHYDRARAEALADLKTALEATPAPRFGPVPGGGLTPRLTCNRLAA